MTIDQSELNRRFWPCELTGEEERVVDTLRHHFEALAGAVVRHTPASREQSLALTQLEQAAFWSVAAIARHRPAG